MFLTPFHNLNSLPTFDGELNAAGLASVWLIPAKQLTLVLPLRPADMGLPDGFIDVRSLQLADGANFLDIPFQPDFGSCTENMESLPNGNFNAYTIQLLIPKDRPDVTAWIGRTWGMRWIALVQDRNGMARLIGTPEQPLSMVMGNGTGDKSGRNVRQLTFTTSTIEPAPYFREQDHDLIRHFVAYQADFSNQ